MEGMSESVLDKRANAVISTLWQVNDKSTEALMADFYKRWIGSGGKLTKAEALRQAELGLLRGGDQTEIGAASRGVSLEFANGRGRFGDPYYWAPFVLMGNWQ